MKKLLLTAALAVLVATAALPTAEAKGERFPLALVIKLTSPAEVDEVTDRIDDEHVTGVHPLVPERNLFLLQTDGEIEIDSKGKLKIHGGAKKWLDKLAKDHDVAWVTVTGAVMVDDQGFHAWGFHAWGFHAWGFHAWPDSHFVPVSPTERFEQPALDTLELERVHEMVDGDGVKVAVVDTGIDADHPLLAGRVEPGLDLVDLDDDPSEELDGRDDDGDGLIDEAWGHGTFVAGMVAQVAPNARIVPIRVLDADGRAEQWAVIEAIEYAIEMDVDVINLSFGLPYAQKSDELKDVLKRATKEHDIVVLAAAGNQADDAKQFPASEKDVLGVGALGRAGEDLAEFSNRGKWVELAAPGADVVSAVPGGGWARWAGTSVATPIAAGAAALMLEADPTADPKAIGKALREGARELQGKENAETGMLDLVAGLAKLDVDVPELAALAPDLHPLSPSSA